MAKETSVFDDIDSTPGRLLGSDAASGEPTPNFLEEASVKKKLFNGRAIKEKLRFTGREIKNQLKSKLRKESRTFKFKSIPRVKRFTERKVRRIVGQVPEGRVSQGVNVSSKGGPAKGLFNPSVFKVQLKRRSL